MNRPFFLGPDLCQPFLLTDSLPRKDGHNLPERAKHFANHHTKVRFSVRSKIFNVGFIAPPRRVPITANEIRTDGYLRGPRKLRCSPRIESLRRESNSSRPDAVNGEPNVARLFAVFVL